MNVIISENCRTYLYIFIYHVIFSQSINLHLLHRQISIFFRKSIGNISKKVTKYCGF